MEFDLHIFGELPTGGDIDRLYEVIIKAVSDAGVEDPIITLEGEGLL